MIQEQPVPEEKDLSNIRYIISDWDGTLIDSWSQYLDAFAILMQERFGIDPDTSKEYYDSTAGESLAYQIQDAARKFAGINIKETLPLENLFWDNQNKLPLPPVIDGALETLRELKGRGYTVIVWSGTRSDILKDRLEKTGLGKYVDFSVSNEPGNSAKVKGGYLFTQISNYLKIPIDQLREKAVITGDGKGDIEGGIQVGCQTIGIPKKPEDGKVLEDAGADFVIPSIKNLLSLFT